MALTDIQKVRLNVGDTDVSFPFLVDETYSYFLENNNNSIDRASVDAAKAILFQLSIRSGAETIDIFSVKNTSPETYRQALELYLKNPNLNPLIRNLKGWIGGTSKSEMATNDATLDNNFIQSPSKDRPNYPIGYFSVGV